MTPALERKVIEEAYGVRIAPDVAPAVENTSEQVAVRPLNDEERAAAAHAFGSPAVADALRRESIDASSISDGPARVALPMEPIDVFLMYDDGNPAPADRVNGELRGLLHAPAARTNTKAWAEFHPSTKTLNGLRSVIAAGGRTWLRETGTGNTQEVKAEFDGPDTVLLFELPQ